MSSARKPWWQKATAVVSLSASGAVTGFAFAPKAAPDLSSPSKMMIHLMALDEAGQPAKSGQAAATGDARLRSAIVSVARYYLRMAAGKTPAEMEAVIWDHDSIDGANHGESCAAFASLTLELGARVIGEQSWVTGGTTYPWPLHKWADVRVDPNPDSLGITSVLQDAQAHDRWHPLSDGYRPLPGDWVLFHGHVEVVTDYSGGVLHTIGGDSLPDYSVNAHEYHGSLAADGVAGFVNNGDLDQGGPAAGSRGAGRPATRQSATHHQAGRNEAAPSSARHQASSASARHGSDARGSAVPGTGAGASSGAGTGARRPSTDRPSADGQAAIPGTAAASGDPAAATSSSAAAVASDSGGQASASHGRGTRATAAAAGDAAIPGLSVPERHRPQHHEAQHQESRRQDSQRHGQASRPTAPAAPRSSQAGQAESGRGTSDQGTSDIPGVPVTTARHVPASAPSAPTHRYTRHHPSPPAVPAGSTTEQQAFISAVAPGAIAAQSEWGVPASVTIAQAIDESGWGRSELAARDHNLFGIKGDGPAGSVAEPTQEYVHGRAVQRTADFRVYQDDAQSISDHGKLLATSGYYSRAMANRQSPDTFAADLTGIYATDPNYGAKLVGLMRRYNLYRYDKAETAGASSSAGQASPAGDGGQGTDSSSAATTAGQSDAGQDGAGDGGAGQDGAGQSGAGRTSTGQVGAASTGQASTAHARTGHANTGHASESPPAAPARTRRPDATPARTGRSASKQPPSAQAAGLGSAAIPGLPDATPPASQQQAAGTQTRQAARERATGAATGPGAGAAGSDSTGQNPASAASPDPGQSGHASRSAAARPRPESWTDTTFGSAQQAAAPRSEPRPAAAPRRPAPRRPAGPRRPAPRRAPERAVKYQKQIPVVVQNTFAMTARLPLMRAEPVYRDVADQAGIRWQLLAACDWMQCKAQSRYSPVHGEKLGSVNLDGTSYRTRSEALEQCADDLLDLSWAVYQIDLTRTAPLSVRDLANVFAAFRWGGLLKLHRTSAMEFPYSVAGLTDQHSGMRWPNISDSRAPDKPGSRFRPAFGAVPVVLILKYPASA